MTAAEVERRVSSTELVEWGAYFDMRAEAVRQANSGNKRTVFNPASAEEETNAIRTMFKKPGYD